MQFAKVVFGLPLDGPFDYLIPSELEGKVKAGSRVRVSFANRKLIGFLVGTSKRSKIKNLKPLLEVIDAHPVINKEMLTFTKDLSDYYCCSWGQAIQTSLPLQLRKGKKITSHFNFRNVELSDKSFTLKKILIHDCGLNLRHNYYIEEIKSVINAGKSAIVILADKKSVLKFKEAVANLNISCLALSYRNQPNELEEWLKIKNNSQSLVIGTRSAVFAPVNNLGLIIVDSENDPVYKQEQVPHYHVREASIMRSDLEKASIIFGSYAPTLEIMRLVKESEFKLVKLENRGNYPSIKIINMQSSEFSKRKKGQLSKYLEDAIYGLLGQKKKILLFLDRKGYATFARCLNCGIILKCERCSINLGFHFKKDILVCHRCNFQINAPKICPQCNSGYIHYSGAGTEKLENELVKMFPQAKIKRIDDFQKDSSEDADIFISTSSVLKSNLNFDLIGVLGVDNMLNRPNLRGQEKIFSLLSELIKLTDKSMIIQTNLDKLPCFEALLKDNPDIFYDFEIRQRRSIKYPPFYHFALIKIRGKNEPKVASLANQAYEAIKDFSASKIEIISLNKSQTYKLRGNFYWEILLKAVNPRKMSRFIKKILKNLKFSGIVTTVDIDPI